MKRGIHSTQQEMCVAGSHAMIKTFVYVRQYVRQLNKS
jgi:hypothetical protein